MGSLTERQCANGDACVEYAALGEPAKLSRYNTDEICNKCQEAKRAAQSVLVPVPPEYEKLVRAAKALFTNGIADEDAIIPTLVFAGASSEAPHLGRLWDSLVTDHRRNGTWTGPQEQLLL